MADSEDPETLITPLLRPPLDGGDRFRGLDASVGDFWAFALSDLRMNNVRGWLGEYLVWRALGVTSPRRIEWDDFDVEVDGIRIEVKTSAYLQAWPQRRISALSFSGLRSRSWPAGALAPASEPTYNADVYVFAIQSALTHDALEPLDVGQWRFAVLPREVLEPLRIGSIAWSRVVSLAGGELLFDELAAAVRTAVERPRY